MGRRRARSWNRPERRCSMCGDPIWQRPDGLAASRFCSAGCRTAADRLSEQKRIAGKRKRTGAEGDAVGPAPPGSDS